MDVTERSKQKSGSQPPRVIPEMEIGAFVKLMKDSFNILSEPVENRPNQVRLVAHPYRTDDPACRYKQVPTHNGGKQVSPLVIKAVLEKFGITEEKFLDELAQPSRGPMLVK
jgi:hypothetical protein